MRFKKMGHKGTLTALIVIVCTLAPGAANMAKAAAGDTQIQFIKYKNYLIPIEVITPPEVPGTLSANATQLNGSTFSWGASVDAEFYQLERRNPGNGTWEVVYSGTDTSYIQQNLAFGSNQFRVRACVAGRCSLASNIVEASPDYIEGYPGDNAQCTPRNFQ